VSGVWFPEREKEPVRLQQSEFATRTWGGGGGGMKTVAGIRWRALVNAVMNLRIP